MSGTASSADLLLRRIKSYLEDVEHILRHEILSDQERLDITNQMRYIEIQSTRIFKLVDDEWLSYSKRLNIS